MKYKVIKKRPGGPEEGELVALMKIFESGMVEIGYKIDNELVEIKFHSDLIDEYLDEYIEKKRPMSWEELGQVRGYYIDDDDIAILDNPTRPCEKPSEYGISRILRPTEEMAEAQLALSQLMQLRDARRDGWKPDGEDDYFCMNLVEDHFGNDVVIYPLGFPTEEIGILFKETFKDLIEKIKPLYFS